MRRVCVPCVSGCQPLRWCCVTAAVQPLEPAAHNDTLDILMMPARVHYWCYTYSTSAAPARLAARALPLAFCPSLTFMFPLSHRKHSHVELFPGLPNKPMLMFTCFFPTTLSSEGVTCEDLVWEFRSTWDFWDTLVFLTEREPVMILIFGTSTAFFDEIPPPRKKRVNDLNSPLIKRVGCAERPKHLIKSIC